MLSRSSTENGKSIINMDLKTNSKTAYFNYGSFSNDIDTDDDLIFPNKPYSDLLYLLFNRFDDLLLFERDFDCLNLL